MGRLGTAIRRLMSRGDAGFSVPAMDGVFKPDNRLEQAERLLTLDDIDNLVPAGAGLLCSSGNSLRRIELRGAQVVSHEIARFEGEITFIARAPDGGLALGVEGQGIHAGKPGSWKGRALPRAQPACAVAGAFAADGTLFVCIGSARHGARAWKRDLMELGRSGSILAFPPGDGLPREIAAGLAFPYGIVALPGGRIAVSESWRHRILELDPHSGARRILVEDLPAYPARLAPASGAGFWLGLFAPRRQLFELVLREHNYRREMMATIDPGEWVGPDLAGSARPDQPIQQGSIRQMGVLKPWGPSQSYGLVARCDADMNPLESWHSRADGTMHGITSVCELAGAAYAASRGSGTLLRLPAGGKGSSHG